MVGLMAAAVVLAVLPLLLILGILVVKGASSLDWRSSRTCRPRPARPAAACCTPSSAR